MDADLDTEGLELAVSDAVTLLLLDADVEEDLEGIIELLVVEDKETVLLDVGVTEMLRVPLDDGEIVIEFVGVTDGEGVAVTDALAVRLGVGLKLDVGVVDLDTVAVGVPERVPVLLDVREFEVLRVDDGVLVGLGDIEDESVWETETLPLPVEVGVIVELDDPVTDDEELEVGVLDELEVVEAVGELLALGVGETELVPEGVFDCVVVEVPEGELLLEGVLVAVIVVEAVALFVGEDELVGERVALGVLVSELLDDPVVELDGEEVGELVPVPLGDRVRLGVGDAELVEEIELLGEFVIELDGVLVIEGEDDSELLTLEDADEEPEMLGVLEIEIEIDDEEVGETLGVRVALGVEKIVSMARREGYALSK